MRSSNQSGLRILVWGGLLCIIAGWLFYFFGVEPFLEAAYRGDSWSYFNEYAARWRGRQVDPTLDQFLEKARAILFRYAFLGTTVVLLVSGLYYLSPKSFHSFFQKETSPYNLALFRIAIFGLLLTRDLDSAQWYAQLPDSLQFPPPGLSFIVPFVPTDLTLIAATKLVFWGASICGMIGLYTRLSTTVALLSGLYVMGIPQLYGKVNHYHHLIWFTALLVPSRCADVLSVDALWNARNEETPTSPQPDRTYAIPIRYAWLLLGLIYFFPGFWKFVSEGFGWAFSENLKYQLRTHWFTKGHMPFFRMDQYPLLYQGGAFFTLLFEIGFIFTLPFRWVRPLGAFTAFLFHESTRLFLSIYFWTVYPVLVFFFDVRKLLVRASESLFSSQLTLTYDEDVSWQSTVVGMLLRLDLLDRLQVQKRGVVTEGDRPSVEEESNLLAVSAPSADENALWKRGRFQFPAGLRLVRYVPPTLLLLPLGPFVKRMSWSTPVSKSSRSTGALAIHLVGGLLVAANLVCGVAKINSYPFSVYPMFAVKGDSTVKTLRITGIEESGASVDVLSGVQEHDLAGFAPGRLRGLIRSIFRVDDPSERTQKLRALWSVLREQRADLRSISSVQFYEATYSNDPDRTSDPLLSKEMITTLDVSSSINPSSMERRD